MQIPIDVKMLTTILSLPVHAITWLFEGEPLLVSMKLLFLFLPLMLLAIIYWTGILSIPTLLFRKERTKFVATNLINIWDGGRSVMNFWSGIFRFIYLSLGWIYGALRISTMGLYQTLKDILFSPITILTDMAKNYAMPGIPWIAVLITLGWIALESSIFTVVLAPLVSDILSGMTNTELPAVIISTGLYVFLFLVVGGSLACMHGLVDAIDRGKKATVFKMLSIEFIVMMVEVVFFYREFVEAILPFFNRMTTDGINIGPIAIISIATFAWVGVRSSTWFFFGKYGTPTLLMVISREGINGTSSSTKQSKFPIGQPLVWIKSLTKELQDEINWFSNKGNEMTNAFMLPPIQILAVVTNFSMHTLTGKNLFNLPIRSLNEIKDTTELIEELAKNLKEA